MKWPRRRRRDDRPPRPIEATALIRGAAAGRWLREHEEAWGGSTALVRGVYVQGAMYSPVEGSELHIVFGGECVEKLPYEATALDIARACLAQMAKADLSFARDDVLDLQVRER